MYFSGYGVFVILGVQIGCLILAMGIVPENSSSLISCIYMAVSCFVSAGLNYAIAKFLNRKKVIHTVGGMKLENGALWLGVSFLFFTILAAVI